MVRDCECRASPTEVIEFAISTTSGIIALANLQAQIDGLQRRATEGGLPAVSDRAELIELVAMRGHLLGAIADYELAEKRADELCRNHPDNGMAYLSRARSRARFHRFAEALTDLDEAERLGADFEAVNHERATLLQAEGEYDAALALLRRAAEPRMDFATLGALAVLHSECNDCVSAEKFFHDSRDLYRGVSPIPLAILEFQFGHMWMSQQNLDLARFWFQTAVDRLPGFAPAQGHLAEVEAMCGETDRAIERLLPLTTSSDDPDYAASLARILRDAGRVVEVGEWRSKAAARYDELMTQHPEAFADHAAEFWLEAGNDPHQALRFAKMNFEVRQTRRARQLFDRATIASEAAQTVPNCIVKV